MKGTDATEAAGMLLGARNGGALLDDLPATLAPTSRAAAYAIQDATIARLGEIGGWKLAVGTGGKPHSSAPIPASRIFASPARIDSENILATHLEVEIAVRMGADLPERDAPYGEAEVAEAIRAIHSAVEILGSRFRDRKAVSALARMSDLQNNAGILIGGGLEDWTGFAWESQKMTLSAGGTDVRQAAGTHPRSAVLLALTWLANIRRNAARPLRAGDLVITGAPNMTAWPMPPKGRIRAFVEGLGDATAEFI